jgi:hypothetical protein
MKLGALRLALFEHGALSMREAPQPPSVSSMLLLFVSCGYNSLAMRVIQWLRKPRDLPIRELRLPRAGGFPKPIGPTRGVSTPYQRLGNTNNGVSRRARLELESDWR